MDPFSVIFIALKLNSEIERKLDSLLIVFFLNFGINVNPSLQLNSFE